MRRTLNQAWKWIAFVLKGVALLPAYYRFWGLRLGTRRIVRAAVLPGLQQMLGEMEDFTKLNNHTRPQSSPDYIVVAPDFASYSAGNYCLYQLCANLRALGFEAVITGSQKCNPKLETPLISIGEAVAAAKAGSWVIYPEIVNGNPLRAKNVVRWVLNKPGLLGGQSIYPQSEHVFVYSDVFAPYVKNKIQAKLYMPTLDRTLFYPPEQDTARSMECYYVGKSRYKEGYVKPDLALEITRTTPPKSELGKIFRVSRVLYCFDNSTALIYEALLCGCPVVVIPDGTQTWEDYEKLELGTDGIHWGDTSQIGPFRPHALQERLANWEREYYKQLEYLVEYTQRISKSERFDLYKTRRQTGLPLDKSAQVQAPELA